MTADVTLLRAALSGYEAQLAKLNSAIDEIREALSGSNGVPRPAPSTESRISAAGRSRIAKAQKRRWAAYRKSKR